MLAEVTRRAVDVVGRGGAAELAAGPAFATFGAVAPWLARTVGLHHPLLSLVAVATGLGARVTVDDDLPFLVLSMLGLVGMATANVLLPSLVEAPLPDRVGFVTGAVHDCPGDRLTGALTLTVPISEAAADDGWRVGLGVWACWRWSRRCRGCVWCSTNGSPLTRLRPSASRRDAYPAGSRDALLFGLQSMHAYAAFDLFARSAGTRLPADDGRRPRPGGGERQHPAVAVATDPGGTARGPTHAAGGVIAATRRLPADPGARSLAVLWAPPVGVGCVIFPLC